MHPLEPHVLAQSKQRHLVVGCWHGQQVTGLFRSIFRRYSDAFRVPLMLGAHVVLGSILVYRAAKLHGANYTQAAVQNFYRWIWNLFYSEYFLLPLI